jgi:AraC family transcriptional regulator
LFLSDTILTMPPKESPMQEQEYVALQVKIIERTAFVCLGVLQRSTPGDSTIPALWERWGPTLSQTRSTEPGHFYGVMDNFGGEPFMFDYVAAVAVEVDASAPEGFVLWDIPTQTYAVFDTTLMTIHETIHQIHSEWFPTSGYKRAMGPEFEQYTPDFDNLPSKPLTIWIPVTK